MEISSLSYSAFEGGHSLVIAKVSAFGMISHLGAVVDVPVRFVYFGAYNPSDKRVFNTGDIPKNIETIKQFYTHFASTPGLQIDYLTVEIAPTGTFRRFDFNSDCEEFTAVFDSWAALKDFSTTFLDREGFDAATVNRYLEAHPRQRIRIERPANLIAVEKILV
jgi:hypothetical protein